nr:immunoglobulin superfamily member 6 isoform X1 [Pogona vitticeps]
MAIFKQHILFMALEFTWVSYCAGPDQCKVTAKQLPFMEANPQSNNINLSCEFSIQSCPTSARHILWFRYLAHTHEELCKSTCKNSVKFKAHQPSTHQAVLQIDQLSVEDSAIYYCGIAIRGSNSTTSKTTGTGTLLVVRETKRQHTAKTAMTGISVLLSLYLMAILVISKFASEPKVNNTETADLKEKHNDCAKGSREAIGRAIAKEIRKKKHNRGRWPSRLTNIFKRGEPS